MHPLTFLQDLAVVMIVAALVTLLFQRLRLPVVLGYIVAGVIIGPHTPPFPLVRDPDNVQTLADLGIVFLMFALGLEFDLRKLRQVGLPSAIAAVLEIALMVAVGFAIGRAYGWKSMDAIFLGAMLAISSTTIIVKALGELGRSRERFAQLIFGILVIEDMLAIVMIALLSSLAMTGSMQLTDVGLTMGRLAVFLVTALVTGLIVVPRLLNHIARSGRDEMLLVTVLGLCFGFSLLAVRLGYSVALGAFVMGAIIATWRQLPRILRLTEPLRDMFSAVFFVAIGLLIDPQMLREHAGPVAVIAGVVLVGKILACTLGTFIAGTDLRTSLRVGMGLAQIGEFSFIIAALGTNLKVTSDFLYPIAVSVSALTTLTTPLLIRSADGLVTRLDRRAPAALTSALALYTRWARDLFRELPRQHRLAPARSLCWQIAINLTVLSGIFLGAALLKPVAARWPVFAHFPGGARTACWLGAVVINLPIYVATIRKLEALALMLAELTVSRPTHDCQGSRLRPLVARLILIAGLGALTLLTMLLSIAIQPPRELLFGLLAVVAVIVAVFGAAFNRLYSRAKFALLDAWNTPPVDTAPEPPPLPPLLHDAVLESVEIPASPLAGRRIRDLDLRARTGASIVGFERGGLRLVNPGPDELLEAGDRVLLLGDGPQLAAARDLLTGPA